MTAAGAMNPRKATKHDALRDAQLRLKALVCETVSLRESLHRESERKGVALDSAKQQQQAAKSADRRLREAEFAARRLRRELEASEAAHGRTTAKYRSGLAEVRSSLVAMQQQARNRSDQAATLAHATFAHLQMLESVLFGGRGESGPACAHLPQATSAVLRRLCSQMRQGRSDLLAALGSAPLSADPASSTSQRPRLGSIRAPSQPLTEDSLAARADAATQAAAAPRDVASKLERTVQELKAKLAASEARIQEFEKDLLMERARTIQAQLGGNAKANVAAGRGAHAESVARELESLQMEQARLRARAKERTAELAETERKAECLAQQNAKLTAESDLLLTELRRTHTAAERGLQEAQRWQHSAQAAAAQCEREAARSKQLAADLAQQDSLAAQRENALQLHCQQLHAQLQVSRRERDAVGADLGPCAITARQSDLDLSAPQGAWLDAGLENCAPQPLLASVPAVGSVAATESMQQRQAGACEPSQARAATQDAINGAFDSCVLGGAPALQAHCAAARVGIGQGDANLGPDEKVGTAKAASQVEEGLREQGEAEETRSSGGSDRARRAAALHRDVQSLDAEIADLQQAFAAGV